jgi:hypothetical protein
MLQDSFEGFYVLAVERTPVRFLDFFKAFRQIYSIKLTKAEAVNKLSQLNKIEIVSSHSLINQELLDKAKWIIE